MKSYWRGIVAAGLLTCLLSIGGSLRAEPSAVSSAPLVAQVNSDGTYSYSPNSSNSSSYNSSSRSNSRSTRYIGRGIVAIIVLGAAGVRFLMRSLNN